MEGHGKGNGVPCITVGGREQDEVTKLKEFNKDGGCQYIDLSFKRRVKSHLLVLLGARHIFHVSVLRLRQ